MAGVLAGVTVGIVGVLAFWRPWSQGNDPEWLFAYAAESATFADRGDGSYTVELAGVDDQFLAFTDRPDRDVNAIDVDTMVEMWPTMFGDSPPNAVLVERNIEGGGDSLVVEITGLERTSDGVRMQTQILSDQTPDGGVLVGEGVRDYVPAEAGPVRLFIDDADSIPMRFYCTTGGRGSQESVMPSQVFVMPDESAASLQFVTECRASGGVPF